MTLAYGVLAGGGVCARVDGRVLDLSALDPVLEAGSLNPVMAAGREFRRRAGRATGRGA